MVKTTKKILSLNHEEVKDFFTKSEQYHGFEQSEHFTFDEVQKRVREKIGDAPHKGGGSGSITIHIAYLLVGSRKRCITFAE